MNRNQALAVARKAAHAHAARLAADAAAAASDAIRARARAALASPQSPQSQRADMLAAIRNAAMRMDTRIIRIAAVDFAKLANFSEIPKNHKISENPKNASFALMLAVGAFLNHQNPDTLGDMLAAITGYESSLLAAHDRRPAAILAADVPGFDPQPPPLKRTPVGALDWQTIQPIGENPADLCEFAQTGVNPAAVRRAKKNGQSVIPKRLRMPPKKAKKKKAGPVRPLFGIATLTLPRKK